MLLFGAPSRLSSAFVCVALGSIGRVGRPTLAPVSTLRLLTPLTVRGVLHALALALALSDEKPFAVALSIAALALEQSRTKLGVVEPSITDICEVLEAPLLGPLDSFFRRRRQPRLLDVLRPTFSADPFTVARPPSTLRSKPMLPLLRRELAITWSSSSLRATTFALLRVGHIQAVASPISCPPFVLAQLRTCDRPGASDGPEAAGAGLSTDCCESIAICRAVSGALVTPGALIAP